MTESVDQLKIKQLLKEIELMTPYTRLGEQIIDHWQEDCVADLDGFTIQELAEETGALYRVDGGYNPDVHEDIHGAAEKGDPWYMQAKRATFGL